MYIHCIYMYIDFDVHTCIYIVQTCMYMFIQEYTCFNLYRHVHTMYKHVYTCLFPILCLHTYMSKYVQLMFSVQLATYSLTNVQTLLNVVHTLMYPFRCQLFDLLCWLACRQGLAGARCHTYSSSSTQI